MKKSTIIFFIILAGMIAGLATKWQDYPYVTKFDPSDLIMVGSTNVSPMTNRIMRMDTFLQNEAVSSNAFRTATNNLQTDISTRALSSWVVSLVEVLQYGSANLSNWAGVSTNILATKADTNANIDAFTGTLSASKVNPALTNYLVNTNQLVGLTNQLAHTNQAATIASNAVTSMINTNAFVASLGGSATNLTVNSDITASNLTWSGAEYLRDWQGQIAKINSGIVTQAVIAVIGDSWVAQDKITGPLRTNLQKRFGNAGAGYVSGVTNTTTVASPDGITKGHTGTWTNAFQVEGLSVSAGRTVDSATPASMSVTSVVSSFVIHFIKQSGGGSFRHSVDGGAWTTNATTNPSIVFGCVTNGGLSLASHYLTIELVDAGSSGIAICGVDCQSTNTGVRLHNLGYGGSIAEYWVESWIDTNFWQSALAVANPSLVGILLGTNEKLTDATPDSYGTNIYKLINRIRAGVTNADILLIAPGDNGGAGTNTMADYEAVLERIARTNRVGFVSGLRGLGDYATANGRGLYLNSTHPNFQGGGVIADAIAEMLIPKDRSWYMADTITAKTAGMGSPVSGTDAAYFGYSTNITALNFALKQTAAGVTTVNAPNGQAVQIAVNNSPILTAQTTGRIGIQTNLPQEAFHLRGHALIESNAIVLGSIINTDLSNNLNSISNVAAAAVPAGLLSSQDVVTNMVAGKIPYYTNASSVVFYLLVVTNAP